MAAAVGAKLKASWQPFPLLTMAHEKADDVARHPAGSELKSVVTVRWVAALPSSVVKLKLNGLGAAARGGGDLADGGTRGDHVVGRRSGVRDGHRSAGRFLLAGVVDIDVVDQDRAVLDGCRRIGEIQYTAAAVSNQRATVAVSAAPVSGQGRAADFQAVNGQAVAGGECDRYRLARSGGD